MQAIRFFPPGGPEKLQLQTENIPKPKKDEVLIQVRAVSVIYPELTWPVYDAGPHIPGHDFAGVVVRSTSFPIGSEVCAFTSRRNHEGGMAEYAIADPDQVVLKPKNYDFVQAASVPLSALTAWQALFDHGKLKAGQKLLITGAAGGTGLWAVQMAKMIGAHVTGTASDKRSQELLQRFGIDRIVNYKTETVAGEFDLILDCVGGQALTDSFKVAKGLVISIVDFECQKHAKEVGVEGLFFIVSMNADQLNQIVEMIEKAKLHTIIDKTYPLAEARRAFEEAARGHTHGKLVLSVSE